MHKQLGRLGWVCLEQEGSRSLRLDGGEGGSGEAVSERAPETDAGAGAACDGVSMVTECSIAVFSEFIVVADAVTKRSFNKLRKCWLHARPGTAMTGSPLSWGPRGCAGVLRATGGLPSAPVPCLLHLLPHPCRAPSRLRPRGSAWAACASGGCWRHRCGARQLLGEAWVLEERGRPLVSLRAGPARSCGRP